MVSSADAVAAEALDTGGPERLRDRARRLGRSAAELLPSARAGERSDRPAEVPLGACEPWW